VPVVEDGETGARPDPQPARAVDVQYGDGLARDGRFVAAVEHGEACAVEAGQTFLGADPKVSIGRAGERLRCALRQSVGNLPVIEDVLAQPQVGVEGKRIGGHGAQDERE
jgi:hypothetical protein